MTGEVEGEVAHQWYRGFWDLKEAGVVDERAGKLGHVTSKGILCACQTLVIEAQRDVRTLGIWMSVVPVSMMPDRSAGSEVRWNDLPSTLR